jgi:hypothetical protein
MAVPKMRSLLKARQKNGALAQLGERNTGSVEVSGSIPLGSTNSTKRAVPSGTALFVCTFKFIQ